MIPRPVAGGLLAIVGATLLWGATFVVIRDAVRDVPPVRLVWLRFAAASLVFAAILVAGRRRPDRATLAGGMLAGLCAAGGYLFQAAGLRSVSAGTSAFITTTGSLLAGLFAWPLLGQRPGGTLLGGLALALAGAALLAGPFEWRLGVGELWTFLGAVCFGLQIVAVGRFVPPADALGLTAVHAFVIAAILTPFAGPVSERLAPLAGHSGARVAYLIVAGSVIAPYLHVRAQRVIPPGRIGLLLGLEPVFALLFALTWGAERFAFRWWAGALLILAGIAIVELREASRTGSSPRESTS